MCYLIYTSNLASRQFTTIENIWSVVNNYLKSVLPVSFGSLQREVFIGWLECRHICQIVSANVDYIYRSLKWKQESYIIWYKLIPLRDICVTNDHGYVPLVVNTFPSLPNGWLITGFVTRVTRLMPIVEQELLPPLEHLSSPPIQTVDVFDRNPK